MDRSARWLLVIVPVAAVALWWGWRTMFFVCDDAYITFRYVSMRQAGWGYTWNPPPFAPVEGYTSFLWAVLLDVLWTVGGWEPPHTAPILGLWAALGTLLTTTAMAWRVELGPRLEPLRPLLVALVLIGVLTNKTFLVWTSSGLEAPLAIALEVGWFAWAVFAPRGAWWAVAGSVIASVTALVRPDGLLQLAATPVVIAAARFAGRPGDRHDRAALLPPLVVVAHLLWRRATYGEWLPNTWFAKVAEPWPYGGFSHLWWWILENGWFLWAPPLLVLAWRTARTGAWRDWRRHAPGIVAVATLAAHMAYYVLKVGGDHFEFRIYAHLPPLFFVGALAVARRLDLSPRSAVALLTVWIAGTWPVAWTDHLQNTRITDVEKSKWILEPVADDLWFLGPWATADDTAEKYCVKHKIGTPHQTHKLYRMWQSTRFLTREASTERVGPEAWSPDAPDLERYPITAIGAVGLAGWRYPYVAILDKWGLSDRVIARNYPVDPNRSRVMAHDRYPPPGYLECFRPNTLVYDKLKVGYHKPRLTADDIVSCETEWLAKIREAPMPPPKKEKKPEPTNAPPVEETKDGPAE